MTGYGKGLHRPDPAKLARRLHASLHPGIAKLSGAPNGAAELVPCARLNQYSKGYCHAFSASGFVWTRENAIGKTLPFIPSPTMIAGLTYAAVQGPADQRGPLQDTGADLQDDAAAMAAWGVAPIRTTSTTDGITDVDGQIDGQCPEPDASQIVVAGSDLVQGAYTIPVDSGAPDMCALALDAKEPIWFGGPVNAIYQELGPNDVATAAAAQGPDGHAQYINKYFDDGTGRRLWLIQGSWGYGFANQGAALCDDSFLTAQWMLFIGAVTI